MGIRFSNHMQRHDEIEEENLHSEYPNDNNNVDMHKKEHLFTKELRTEYERISSYVAIPRKLTIIHLYEQCIGFKVKRVRRRGTFEENTNHQM